MREPSGRGEAPAQDDLAAPDEWTDGRMDGSARTVRRLGRVEELLTAGLDVEVGERDREWRCCESVREESGMPR